MERQKTPRETPAAIFEVTCSIFNTPSKSCVTIDLPEPVEMENHLDDIRRKFRQ